MKHKYWKEENCDYPVENDGISYCWGYASFVDKGNVSSESIKEFESISCANGGMREGDPCECYRLTNNK